MSVVFEVTFEYNGRTVQMGVAPDQRIEGAWHRALAQFNIRPDDAQNLGLFFNGNLLNGDQDFRQAGIGPGALLRIQPVVQRTGY